MTTNPNEPTAPKGRATPNRKGRLNKSRAVAAGASVGALVLVTAGIAAANPAKNNSSTGSRAGAGTNTGTQNQGNINRGDDSGWFGDSGSSSDGNAFNDPYAGGFDGGSGFNDPNSGFSNGGGFNPGFGGGGHSSSGGS